MPGKKPAKSLPSNIAKRMRKKKAQARDDESSWKVVEEQQQREETTTKKKKKKAAMPAKVAPAYDDDDGGDDDDNFGAGHDADMYSSEKKKTKKTKKKGKGLREKVSAREEIMESDDDDGPQSFAAAFPEDDESDEDGGFQRDDMDEEPSRVGKKKSMSDLLGSDDDDDDEDDDDDAKEDELPIEREARLYEDEEAAIQAEADADFREQIAADRRAAPRFKLPGKAKMQQQEERSDEDEDEEEEMDEEFDDDDDLDVDDEDEDERMGENDVDQYGDDSDSDLYEDEDDAEGAMETLPPQQLKDRIHEVVAVLSDFKERRDPNRSRTEYVAQLRRDLCEYYGYIKELAEHFLDMFSPAECVEFMEASDMNRPLVIRTNTLKTRRKDLAAALIKRGVHLDPLASWSKVGLKILESQVPIGATPEYLGGQYTIQAASSMCPVMALAPQPGERVLDMASAPGGKTSYIAQLMKNSGTLVASDLKRERIKSTVANLHRLGVQNTIVCQHNGKDFPKVMSGFDRALLDAPCSGLGVISRDQSVKIQRTMKDVQRNSHLQKELLLAAIDSVNVATTHSAGVVVYSTCSVSVEENEKVVQYALEKRCVKLVDSGLDHGKPGFARYKRFRFHPTMKLTRRFYPHVHNMDGFYVAKFVKFAKGSPVARGGSSGGVGGGDDSGDDEDEDGEGAKQQQQKKKRNMTDQERADAADAEFEAERLAEETPKARRKRLAREAAAKTKAQEAVDAKFEELESESDLDDEEDARGADTDEEDEEEEEEEEEEIQVQPKKQKKRRASEDDVAATATTTKKKKNGKVPAKVEPVPPVAVSSAPLSKKEKKKEKQKKVGPLAHVPAPEQEQPAADGKKNNKKVSKAGTKTSTTGTTSKKKQKKSQK